MTIDILFINLPKKAPTENSAEAYHTISTFLPKTIPTIWVIPNGHTKHHKQ